jgi:CRP-like cAMP-binding protein
VRLGSNQKVDLIRKVPLFSRCSKPECEEVAKIADEIDLPEGKDLTRQRDRGREFFALLDGTVEVRKDGRVINTLGPGDFFGEMALVSDLPRMATVTTTSPVRALVIRDNEFRGLLSHSPEIQRKVLETMAERLGAVFL